MELLEYQAKELFRMVGIPILPSQTIKDSRQIKQLQIPYPVVLKSQVRSGGRGKAGGIKFVANTIDAIAAARTIFNLSILGEYPEVILAEAHYNTEREFFLAIVLDYDLQCPVLLGSAYGGMNVNSLLANLQQVVVDTEFSLFYARRLAAKMGLSGQLICSVSEIIARMYRLFWEQDLDLIEINPLGVNTKGELMALDGKITINDAALARQPSLKTLNFSEKQKQKIEELKTTDYQWLDWQNPTGKVAIIANSWDLALLTWDLLAQEGVTPVGGIAIAGSFWEQNNSVSKIMEQLQSFKHLQVILVNIWETETISREMVKAIAEYLQSQSIKKIEQDGDAITSVTKAKIEQNHSSPPQFVLRLLDGENAEQFSVVAGMSVVDSLATAIATTTSMVKSS